MRGVRAQDLTPEARRRYGLDKPTQPRSKRPKRTDAGTCVGSCGCGERFTSYPAWERHSDQLGDGHRRWTVDEPSDRG